MYDRRNCGTKGCGSKAYCRGVCKKHYNSREGLIVEDRDSEEDKFETPEYMAEIYSRIELFKAGKL